jgi:acyl-CoA thioesterase-1
VTDGSLPIIAMYGDSTTYGTVFLNGAYSVTANSEPSVLGSLLPGAIIENHGGGGSTSFDLLNGAGTGRTPQEWLPNNWWQEMAASKADIVTINLGMNDAFYTDENFFKQAITDLVTIARNAGKTVIVETPNPLAGYYTEPWRDRVAAYAAEAAAAARAAGATVVDQWAGVQKMPEWRSHLPDGIHPDDAMYAFKADLAAAALAPLVPGAVPDGYKVVGVGDFQGNGRSDILIHNTATGNVAQLRTDDGKLTFAEIGWAPPDWQIIGTGDYNGDGTTDILLRSASGFVSEFQLHDGHATWGADGWNWHP